MKNNRRGFTLLELMVVIGIIVILASMITIAVQKVMESSKASTTKGLLQAGVSLLEEWRRPGSSGYPTFPWPIEIVPADLQPGGAGLTSNGFQLSRAALNRMAANPAVKTLMGKIPADRFESSTVDYSALPTVVPNWTNNDYYDVIGYAFKGSFSARSGVQDRFFICYNPPGQFAKDAAPIQGNPESWPDNWRDCWFESTGDGIQILKDAWDRPVLLVPSCGFEARDLNGNVILITSDGVKTQFGPGATFLQRLVWNTAKSYTARDIVIAPLAKSSTQWGLFMCAANHTSSSANQPDTAGGKTLWDRVPSVPFFVSAGSDGILFDPANLSTLQDNHYSFEN